MIRGSVDGHDGKPVAGSCISSFSSARYSLPALPPTKSAPASPAILSTLRAGGMTGVVQVHLEQALDAARDRPGTAIIVTAGGALVVGFLGGHWYAKRCAQQRSAALQRHLTENGVFDSGTSTPRISAAGDTPRSSMTGELSDKLDYSMALLYRTDLPTAKGRFATLCAQACLAQFKKLWRQKSGDLKLWQAFRAILSGKVPYQVGIVHMASPIVHNMAKERNNAVKVCLQVEGEDQLLEVEQAAREAGLPTFTVKDVHNNRRVRSVMAVGPAESRRIREVTSHLKQLV